MITTNQAYRIAEIPVTGVTEFHNFQARLGQEERVFTEYGGWFKQAAFGPRSHAA